MLEYFKAAAARIRGNDEGQTALEYTLVLALALALAGSLVALGGMLTSSTAAARSYALNAYTRAASLQTGTSALGVAPVRMGCPRSPLDGPSARSATLREASASSAGLVTSVTRGDASRLTAARPTCTAGATIMRPPPSRRP